MKSLSASVKENADKIGTAITNVLGAKSVQYAVMYKDEVILSGSVGKYDKGESRPLNKDDMYGIGSTSKVYTTAAALLLVDKGQLDIDKPYKDYVPEFEMADPRYVNITSRHLMNHSSGIYGTHFKGSFLFEDSSTFAHDNMLTFMKNCTLKYDPGTFMEYCNDGFQLLEILIERISGLKINEYFKKYFFDPLGIRNTKTPLDDFDRKQMARCSMPPIYDGDLPYEYTNLISTGGIVSTAEDLCLFGKVLMGKKILSEKSAKMMGEKEYLSGDFWVNDEKQDNIFGYGLGYDHVHLHPFDKVGLKALGKGGDTMMYHAMLIVIPELDLAAAAVSAGGISLTNALLSTENLKAVCLDYGIAKEFPPAYTFETPVKKNMPAELLKCSGLYAGGEKNTVIKFIDSEIEMPSMLQDMVPAQKYIYAGDGKFISADGKNTVFFSEVKGGLTFIQCNLNIELPGIGLIAWRGFDYQKLEKNPINDDIAAVWEKRNGKKYILVDDFYTSAFFLNLSSPHTEVEITFDKEYGYVRGAKIIDGNFARNTLYARDVIDYKFYTKDGAEYLTARNQHYIDTDAIPLLNADMGSVTIAADGFTKMFKVGENTAGKTITVKVPEKGVFAAYGEKPADGGKVPPPLKALTTVMGNNPVGLSKGDLLAFNGSAGDKFCFELK